MADRVRIRIKASVAASVEVAVALVALVAALAAPAVASNPYPNSLCLGMFLSQELSGAFLFVCV